MSPEQINEIAERAADKAVKSVLLSLGINANDPDAILQAQADNRFVRSWRESAEAVKRRGILTAVGFIVIAGLGWLALAFGMKTGVPH